MGPSTLHETKEAHGAATSPPARRLLLVGEWMAKGFMVEGIGWPQPPIPASGALGQRGALRESCIVAFDAPRDEGSSRRGDLATGWPAAPSA